MSKKEIILATKEDLEKAIEEYKRYPSAKVQLRKIKEQYNKFFGDKNGKED